MSEGKQEAGILYLCATPLGNLEDITLRALNVLRESDLIAAEDTRRTIKLLNHYQIKVPLTSYHEHNEVSKGGKLVQEILNGKNVALVSDAGLPGISDPGHHIVKTALEHGVKVVPLPGASAGITALVASGLNTDRFVFEGFLPREKKKRLEALTELALEKRTIVLYEAPHRLKKTLAEILNYLGDRNMVVARELTKIHEQFIRDRLSRVIEIFSENAPKGEFCLIIEGNQSKLGQEESLPEWEGAELLEQLNSMVSQGLTKKEAIKKLAILMGKSKREVYNQVVELEQK